MRIVSAGERTAYWSEGTRSEIVLAGGDDDGSLAVLAEVLPPGQGPPLHSHPQDETFIVLSGTLTVWSIRVEELDDTGDPWTPALLARGIRCEAGGVVRVPGGRAHCYRVDGVRPAEVIVLSHPSGLEEWTRAFGVPATGPGLPPDGFTAPQSDRARMVAFSASVGVRRHGPPAPLAAAQDDALAAPDRIESLPLRAGVSHGLRLSTDAVYLVVEGRADFVAGGERHPLDAGGCVRVPAGVAHVWTAGAGAGAVVLVLDGDGIDGDGLDKDVLDGDGLDGDGLGPDPAGARPTRAVFR
ncbi:cupin domain-containing protein [Microbacterium rhizomatis]|nr:cupin domain-containing protein [Microbacterium rhizomatis]